MAAAALLAGVFAQTDADAIAALCAPTDSASPHDFATTSFAPIVTLSPSSPLTITLSTTESGADAYWMHDDDNDLMAFASVTGTAATHTFDVSARQPRVVTAFVHYASPSCRVAASNVTYTLDGQIMRYFAANDNYGASTWPTAQVTASTPTLAVTYGSYDGTDRSATVSVAIATNYLVPMVYARGPAGELLSFGRPATGVAGYTYTLEIQSFPPFTTALFGCAALGGAEVCTQFPLVSTITSALKTAHPAPSSFAPPAFLASTYTLRIARPSDALCASNYVIWAESADGGVVTFAEGAPLSVSVGPAASCAYATSECLFTVYAQCATSLFAGVVNVSALPSPDGGSAPSGDATPPPHRCEDNHPGREYVEQVTSWMNPATGRLCECFNGVPECGPRQDTEVHITGYLAAVIAVASVVLFVVVMTFCCYMRIKHRQAMATPIEGAKRRSLMMPGQNDYVRSSKKGLVGGEVELPAPPQAADLNESSRVVITRSTIDPAAESAMPPEDAPDAARV